MNRVLWVLGMLRHLCRVYTGKAGSFEASEAELRRLRDRYGITWHSFDNETSANPSS